MSTSKTAPRTAPRTALVTGGNRGIGFEVCRQLAEGGHRVLLAGRDGELAREAAGRLACETMDVSPVTLDVADAASIDGCAADLAAGGIAVDILVNNAGIYPSGDLMAVEPAVLLDGLTTNALGPLALIRAFAPGMGQRKWGRIVNVSSGYGSLSEGLRGPAAYALSKALLNAITLRAASELPASVKVNAMCPGWVRTRMGGPGATRSVAKGADTVVWLATLPDDGPTGGYFRDRKAIAW